MRVLVVVAFDLRFRQRRSAHHSPRFNLRRVGRKVGDLLVAQIRGRYGVFILCCGELRCFVGQDPGGPYGPRGEVGRGL